MEEETDLSPMDSICAEFRGREGDLISILQAIQKTYGYLPESALGFLSREFKIPMARIFSVATFYTQFFLARRGENIIKVCRGTACHVRGATNILSTIESILGIEDGETSADYRFSLETVACLGACAMAPIMVANDEYYGTMTPAKTKKALKKHL